MVKLCGNITFERAELNKSMKIKDFFNTSYKTQINVWMVIASTVPMAVLFVIANLWFFGEVSKTGLIIELMSTVMFIVSVLWWWWIMGVVNALIKQNSSLVDTIEEADEIITELKLLLQEEIDFRKLTELHK